jgi:hypothetical protein
MNGDIKQWLYRRSDPEGMCAISGRLAGEIADYIKSLEDKIEENYSIISYDPILGLVCSHEIESIVGKVVTLSSQTNIEHN